MENINIKQNTVKSVRISKFGFSYLILEEKKTILKSQYVDLVTKLLSGNDSRIYSKISHRDVIILYRLGEDELALKAAKKFKLNAIETNWRMTAGKILKLAGILVFIRNNIISSFSALKNLENFNLLAVIYLARVDLRNNRKIDISELLNLSEKWRLFFSKRNVSEEIKEKLFWGAFKRKDKLLMIAIAKICSAEIKKALLINLYKWDDNCWYRKAVKELRTNLTKEEKREAFRLAVAEDMSL